MDKDLDISVVAPCYNEAKNLPELVARLAKVFAKRQLAGEIVLVDDGSSDDTGAVIDRLAVRYASVVPVHHQHNQGIEAAWKSGLAAATGAYVCLIDADLQNLPEDVWRLYREITTTHADVVQGYRSSVGRLKNGRFILSRGLNWMLNTLFGMRQHDNKSGFVIALRETLADVLRHRFKYRFFQTFITVSAFSKGYRLREIETLFQSRLLGESYMARTPLRVVAISLWELMKAFVEFRLAVKRESILHEFLQENAPRRRDPELGGWRKLLLKIYFWTMPLHAWLITKRAKLYYQELKKSQWLTPEQIRRLQQRKLHRLLHHAYRHVGYYRDMFDRLGLRPSDIRSIENLQKLPLLTKADVRENLYFEMLSDNHDKKKILKVSTSGSTGEPFVCYADQHQLEIRWAATLRSMEWTGYRFGDRQLRLWHQALGMSWARTFRERLDAWLSRRMFVPAYEMSEAGMASFVEKLRKYKPVLIDGYAESFNLLAQYVKGKGLDGINPAGIMSSAQELPEHNRKSIEQAFGSRVFDKYGSREFSGIAYECETHQGHHVVAESFIVEVLKNGEPARPGEVGEVVITDLNNMCLPMIRYRIGDLAVAMDPNEACACGRGLPRVGEIEGRVQSIIVGTNGNYVPGTFFAHLFKDYDHAIRQYQVLQESLGSIRLKIIKAQRFDDASLEELLALLRNYLGEDMVIDVEFVDSIPLVHTGKHQGCISKLQLDFQALESELKREQISA